MDPKLVQTTSTQAHCVIGQELSMYTVKVNIIEDRTHSSFIPTVGRDIPFQGLGFVLESRPTKTLQKDKREDCVVRKCPQILKITNSLCYP